MGFKNIYRLLLMSVALGFSGLLHAQKPDVDSLVARGDSLHQEYCFEDAIEAFSMALEAVQDSILTVEDSLKILDINSRLLLSENGKNMTAFSDTPVVVAKHSFPAEEFFLYYPLEDKAWRPVPNPLDSLSGPFSKAVYVPEGSTQIYYSSADKEGIRNIYFTELQDSLWSEPSLLNEHMTSASDEVYPLVSPDGKKIYFSSKGLHGVGGYDLYVSEWDEQEKDWSVPVNLGFPYSSVADDFLFVNSPDGVHSIFASNRGCSPDSVWVYVLEYNDMPVRKAVDDPSALKQLQMLDPVGYSSGPEEDGKEDEAAGNPEVRQYMDKMEEVRALRDTISLYEARLQEERSRYALSTDDDERMRLTGDILKREADLPVFQDSLDRAARQLQKIELDFLMKGIIIDWDDFMARADKEVVVEPSSYTFTRSQIGGPLEMNFVQPEVKFDYSFMVLPEGRMAEDQTIPQGVVYQIQIFSTSTPAPLKSFRGLSPVYEHRTSSGRYIYRVGLFNTYKSVLENLNTVKKVGFRSAIIVAYIDGKEVQVSKARAEEALKKEVQVFYEVVMTPSSGELDAAVAAGIRQQAPGKDIARSEGDAGQAVYVVGLFADKTVADGLADFVRAMGVDGVMCRQAGMKK